MSVESCDLPDNTFNALDIQLPIGFNKGILLETHTNLINCFIDSLNISSGIPEFADIFKNKLRQIGNQEFRLINDIAAQNNALGFLDSQYMYDILYSAVQDYYSILPLDSVPPRKSYIIVNNIVMNFSNIERIQKPEPIIKPQIRPNWSEDDIYDMRVESEVGENQFEKLRNEGLSPEIIDFIENDIFPSICGEGYECTPESIKNIQELCLFVIDIETSAGEQLQNLQGSSARGYFHFLNQNGRNTDKNSDGIPDWNTIDTTLRQAASKFYNHDRSDLEDWEKSYVENIDPSTDPKANWVKKLWGRNDNNGAGRSGDEFVFDDQLRLFLIRSAVLQPDSMKNILLDKELRLSAEEIYRAHHGNVSQGSLTEQRMIDFLDNYYGYA